MQPETSTPPGVIASPITSGGVPTKSPGQGRTVWIVGLLLVLTVLGGIAALVALVGFGSQPAESVLHGIVEVQEVRLGSKVGGRVAEVLVREGDRVSAGTPLVRLALPELEAQREILRARLAGAVAERDRAEAGPRLLEKAEARAALAAAEARLSRWKKGWREEEITQARNDLEACEADLRQAGREFTRILGLVPLGGATASDLDLIRGTRERATARTNAARARLEMLLKGNRPEEIDEAMAERERLQARYDLLNEGTREEDRAIARAQVAQLEAQIREVEVNLAEGEVRAEETCLVEILSVRKGDIVAAGQPVVRVLRAEDLWVRIYIPEPILAQVRLGQTVAVTLDAYPGKTFAGRIAQIATDSEFTPRNVQSPEQRRHQVFSAKVHVADSRGIFKSGLAAQVSIPLQGAEP